MPAARMARSHLRRTTTRRLSRSPEATLAGNAPMEETMPASVLKHLLDDNARFDVAGRGTVNHLPMALIALSRMGASDARLVEYFGWWEENRALPRRDNGRQ